MATIGVLKYDLIANATQFIRGMRSSTKATKNQSQATSFLTGRMKALGTAVAGYFAISAIRGAMRRGIGAIVASLGEYDELIKQARAIGFTTTQLKGLRAAAAELTGLSVSELDKSLEQFSKRIGEISAYGTGTSMRAFQLLGLSRQDAMGTPEEVLRKVAEGWNNIASSAEKAVVAYDLFGRRGVRFANVLDAGTDALDAYLKKANEWFNINAINEAQVERANDAVYEMQQAWEGLTTTFSAKLAPAVTVAAEALEKLFRSMNRGMDLVNQFALGVGVISDYLSGTNVAAGMARRLQANRSNIAGRTQGVMGSRGPGLRSSRPGLVDTAGMKPIKVEITEVNELARALTMGSAEEYKAIADVNTRLQREEQVRHRERMQAARWGNQTLEQILEEIRQQDRLMGV